MKLTFSLLALGFSLNAQASLVRFSEFEVAMTRPDCIDQLESVLYSMTHHTTWLGEFAASKVKNIANQNLDRYETLGRVIQSNLKTGKSNEAIYKHINDTLDRHAENWYERPIVNCIRANVKFNGTKAEETKAAERFLQKIRSVKKAVNS